MNKYVTPGLWLFLLSLCVSYFPHWFVFHKYQKEHADFPGGGKFLFLFLLQTICFFTCAILGLLEWAFIARGDVSQVLAILSMFYPSVLLPPALFSAVTGIYPVMDRSGYYYYEKHKSSFGETLVPTNKSYLKIVGWLQFIFFTAIVGASLVYVMWQLL